MTEIVILAMIAAFLGLRLYSVLGKRAEHDEQPIPTRFEQPKRAELEDEQRPASQQQGQAQTGALAERQYPGFPPQIDRGLREIAAADRGFELLTFLEGARSAYEMVLEAFWKGDREELRELCDDDVYEGFVSAIDAREAAGETLENRLIRIEETKVEGAEMDGRTARITLRFVSDIAAVTRDAEGQVVAGSLDDAVESRDIWTFSRDTRSASPAWVLDETDEG